MLKSVFGVTDSITILDWKISHNVCLTLKLNVMLIMIVLIKRLSKSRGVSGGRHFIGYFIRKGDCKVNVK